MNSCATGLSARLFSVTIPTSLTQQLACRIPAAFLAATGTGSIYAGAPRTFVAGMRLAFR